MSGYDAIIIGGGPSGLSIVALLAKAGKKVLLLEKEVWLEGRKHSGMIGDSVVENGAHEIRRAGYLEEIFDRIGKEYPTGSDMNKTEINYEGGWRPLLEDVDRKHPSVFQSFEIRISRQMSGTSLSRCRKRSQPRMAQAGTP